MDRNNQKKPPRQAQGPALRAAAIAPVFPVTSIPASTAHYRQLGFDTEEAADGSYAFVRSGHAEIHLLRVPDLNPAVTTSACFLAVFDADSIFDTWANTDVGGHFVPPRDTPYGIREFSHVDIDGNLLRVGSPIA